MTGVHHSPVSKRLATVARKNFSKAETLHQTPPWNVGSHLPCLDGLRVRRYHKDPTERESDTQNCHTFRRRHKVVKLCPKGHSPGHTAGCFSHCRTTYYRRIPAEEVTQSHVPPVKLMFMSSLNRLPQTWAFKNLASADRAREIIPELQRRLYALPLSL